MRDVNIAFAIEFFFNSTISTKSCQNPARIDIQWIATIECQYWQDLAENDELKKNSIDATNFCFVNQALFEFSRNTQS